MMAIASRFWEENWLKEETLSNVDYAFFPLWVAIFGQIIVVPTQHAAAIFGDKIAGAWEWDSSKDGENDNKIKMEKKK